MSTATGHVAELPRAPFSKFLRSPMNWLLLFIPLTIALEHLAHIAAPVLFFMAAVAIIPIAAQIVHATEQISTRTGDAVGGLLNATFGNAPELIIALVALKAGYLDMVRASLVGAILANLLLALGVGFLTGGIRYHDQRFNPTAARAYSSMMFLAAVSLTVPSAFSRVFAPNEVIRQEQLLNIGIALLLLLAYVLYILFSLKTHSSAFASLDTEHSADHHDQWSISRAVITLLAASVFAAWMSEILVGAAEATGKALGMSQVFIGIVFVAVVGGAAESGSAVAMARKNKMDLSVGIALGSCIQIALFVAPLLVLASYFIAPQPLELAFSRAEIGSLLMAVFIGALVCSDGQSNWYKGVQLITVYAIIALMFYLVPQIPG
ncbi:MAG TPA: calcium/proton exchanger [Pyrinomonadaceae bacterium]|nr:calcium/proton exchanger [Pyrinomonadaceae bacterium]HYV13736.1 calcium/proton exchanger [Pyrinomonadaceae bacterium]